MEENYNIKFYNNKFWNNFGIIPFKDHRERIKITSKLLNEFLKKKLTNDEFRIYEVGDNLYYKYHDSKLICSEDKIIYV